MLFSNLQKPVPSKYKVFIMKPVNKLFYCAVLVSFLAGSAFSVGEPIVIGTSNLPTATAFNNARRIVRDADDSLFVFYQDSVDKRPVIRTTSSLHGETWSEPEIFAYGSAPAANISKEDVIYVAYVTENRQGITVKSSLGDEITTSGLLDCNYPSIETTTQAVHVLWQAKREDLQTTNIFYQQFNKDLTLDFPFPFSREVLISVDTTDSKYPVICGSLTYLWDFKHILWTDSSLITGSTFLSYVYLDENYDYPYDPFPAAQKITNSDGFAYPSISDGYGMIAFTCCDLINNGLITAHAREKEGGLDLRTTFLYKTNSIPLPGADDVYIENCAIVWQDNNEIYYGHMKDNYLIDSKAIQISTTGPDKKMYPAVCYKKIKRYYYDIIWTEGNAPPYKIMYSREPKFLSPYFLKIQESKKYIAQYMKKSPYVMCEMWGGVGPYNFKFKDYESLLGPLTFEANWTFWGYFFTLFGTPIKSGSFECTLIVSDSDYPVTSDSIEVTIVVQNAAPQFNSPDSATARIGQKFSYSAHAQDPDSNQVFYQFLDYPIWLSPADSILSGTVPLNAIDTSFTVIATDGDKSDTLSVFVDIDTTQSYVNKPERSVPTKFVLHQNYPNPFNPETTIKCEIPRMSHVKICIYNIKGGLVDVIQDGRLAAGYYSFTWNATDKPSGTYFIRLQTEGYTRLKKCVLLK